MTELLKPFTITETRQEPDGALGVTFEAWRTINISESKRRRARMIAFVRVETGLDPDTVVFEYLQSVGWL